MYIYIYIYIYIFFFIYIYIPDKELYTGMGMWTAHTLTEGLIFLSDLFQDIMSQFSCKNPLLYHSIITL